MFFGLVPCALAFQGKIKGNQRTRGTRRKGRMSRLPRISISEALFSLFYFENTGEESRHRQRRQRVCRESRTASKAYVAATLARRQNV